MTLLYPSFLWLFVPLVLLLWIKRTNLLHVVHLVILLLIVISLTRPVQERSLQEATIEAKVTDGRTGQLLAAGIDRRVGGNEIKATVDSWDDVNKIMELWSRFFRFRLCKLRGDRDCFHPEK